MNDRSANRVPSICRTPLDINAGTLPELTLIKGDVVAVSKEEAGQVERRLVNDTVLQERAGRYSVCVAE